MLFPLKDVNPTTHRPVATYALIALNVAVFLYQLSLAGKMNNAFVTSYGATPFEITRMTDLVGETRADFHLMHTPGPHPIFLTLFTSMFIHGGLLHLLGNMLYLWIFGNNVEDILGPVKFVVFYLVSGLAAHALHIAFDPSSTIPTVGASGAISGLLAGYLIAFPKARILTAVFLGFFVRLATLPAAIVIVFWFVLQLISGLISRGSVAGGGVAWFAHVGGFLGGLGLIYLMAGRTISWLRHGSGPVG